MKKIFGDLTLRFSFFGLLIVVVQSLPNIVWALFPPEINRLDGNASSILVVEYGEHILGVAIVVLLLFLANKNCEKSVFFSSWAVFSYVLIFVYWVCWIFYFLGIQPNLVIYLMVIVPPIAFFSAGIAEKVLPISIISVIFLIFHLLVAMENFPIF